MPAGVAYGLTEFERPRSSGTTGLEPGLLSDGVAARVAAAARAGLIAPSSDIIVDAKSGSLARARRQASARTSENHGSVAAYGVFGHRHTPEMEQALERSVTFVPHLVPLDRGILSSNYVGWSRAPVPTRLASVRAGVSIRAVRPLDG